MDDIVARIRAKLAAACTEPVPRPRTVVRAPGGRRLGAALSEERVAAYEHWLDSLPDGKLIPDFRHQAPGSPDELADVLSTSGSSCERQAAAYTLGGRLPLTDRAREALVRAVTCDPDRGVRMDAIRTLAELDAGAAPVLASALKDPDSLVRRRALVHLLRVSDDETTYGPAARELLRDEHPNVRMAAADLLTRAGWAGEQCQGPRRMNSLRERTAASTSRGALSGEPA
ncbi:HEAT repeat domain-containing protein [Paractinoplanes lichenicola]|uniref:HEAT repeat domain-containing protein n=1 Tax=Paractinoplanes lichenicola TaxID=2802976 RepID=A0ABS1VTQ7_9ACTN|nr:HEAT repeat domain-containing protein [Actinoplanes lichenicola]MBL7257829.1 HEAT repeat domain-containing protein [Actinoplanes lichenicola]